MPETPDPLTDLARLVRRLRERQQAYFRSRHPTVLAECRDLERRVDAAVAAILSPPALSLFGGEP